MEKEYVLFNLHEAAEELAKAIVECEADNEMGLHVQLVFTYRKLNRAWNSRNLTLEQIRDESHDAFESRCRFPLELADEIAD